MEINIKKAPLQAIFTLGTWESCCSSGIINI
jgi:hypothetical protein